MSETPVDLTKETAGAEPADRDAAIRLRHARMSAATLFIPAIFACVGVYSAVASPRLVAKGSGTLAGAEIRNVIVDFHGAWWEHALFAVPYLLIGLSMAYVCRALFRIEVNIETNERPFTERDGRVLGWAPTILLTGSLVAIFSSYLVPALLPSADGLERPAMLEALNPVIGTWLIAMAWILMQMRRIHVLGRKAYEKLEEVA